VCCGVVNDDYEPSICSTMLLSRTTTRNVMLSYAPAFVPSVLAVDETSVEVDELLVAAAVEDELLVAAAVEDELDDAEWSEFDTYFRSSGSFLMSSIIFEGDKSIRLC